MQQTFDDVFRATEHEQMAMDEYYEGLLDGSVKVDMAGYLGALVQLRDAGFELSQNQVEIFDLMTLDEAIEAYEQDNHKFREWMNAYKDIEIFNEDGVGVWLICNDPLTAGYDNGRRDAWFEVHSGSEEIDKMPYPESAEFMDDEAFNTLEGATKFALQLKKELI